MTHQHTAHRNEPRHRVRVYKNNGIWCRHFEDDDFRRLIRGDHATRWDADLYPADTVVTRTQELYPNAVVTVESSS